MTRDELDILRAHLMREAEVVEAMARDEADCLARLRQNFLHQEFLRLLALKKTRMEQLSQLRVQIRPLADQWVVHKRELGIVDAQVDQLLARIKEAFERLSSIELELETLATNYLRQLTQGGTNVQDRINLYRSWGQ